ncbi:uncharacterized protein LOC111038227 isoform X2 [Myzus persicae]|uniref:uncharacterized protein LOC111038227 isoform X2 n=1 Tax=Myzus persicae TaxID=13164 RepID=UPI000B9397BF|nr:uncharacterized protein LOC111038227 isoform X2 [Myzus persicae]
MERFVEQELKEIVDGGAFGKNCHLVSCKLYNYGSHYNVMIKLKILSLELRYCFGCDILFNNELIFYENIMPFLLKCRGPTVNDAHALFLPRFFYGSNKCSELMANDVIVIENVSTLGYCFSNARVFLDYEHLTIALQTLAKFHGLSYTAKHKDPGRINDFLKNVHSIHLDGNGHWMSQHDIFKKCGKRGVDRLLERDGDKYRDHARIRRLNELLDDPDKTLMQTLHAREPLSVICHGDYHRNTLLFQYDDHGRPFDAIAIDFSTIHYGSPALDLSSFLYISTTQRMRELHWDDLLDIYCGALAKSVLPGVLVPSRAEIDAEVAEIAINAFAKASFYLPFMLCDTGSNSLDTLATSDDPVDYFLALGGDMATECIADMVQHFVSMGYTDVSRGDRSNPVKNAYSTPCKSSTTLI